MLQFQMSYVVKIDKLIIMFLNDNAVRWNVRQMNILSFNNKLEHYNLKISNTKQS